LAWPFYDFACAGGPFDQCRQAPLSIVRDSMILALRFSPPSTDSQTSSDLLQPVNILLSQCAFREIGIVAMGVAQSRQ
jgi:hypothetical protein